MNEQQAKLGLHMLKEYREMRHFVSSLPKDEFVRISIPVMGAEWSPADHRAIANLIMDQAERELAALTQELKRLGFSDFDQSPSNQTFTPAASGRHSMEEANG